MGTLAEQLDSMLNLQSNWDGYGADAIQPRMVALAKDFVEFFQVMEKVTDQNFNLHVMPTRVGGVQLEWQDATQEHELEIDTDGSIELLHVDRVTGAMTEEKFFPPTERMPVPAGLLPRLARCGSAVAGSQ